MEGNLLNFISVKATRYGNMIKKLISETANNKNKTKVKSEKIYHILCTEGNLRSKIIAVEEISKKNDL